MICGCGSFVLKTAELHSRTEWTSGPKCGQKLRRIACFLYQSLTEICISTSNKLVT